MRVLKSQTIRTGANSLQHLGPRSPPHQFRHHARLWFRCAASKPNDTSSSSWNEALERRRVERLQGATAAAHGQSSKQAIKAEEDSQKDDGPAFPDEAEMRKQVDRSALELELFAYPSSRSMPWATLVILAAAGGVSTSVAFYWNWVVCRANSVEELEPLLKTFASTMSICSVSAEDLERGELHRLLLASLVRVGEAPAKILAEVAVLLSCGTLLERLHGPVFVFGVMVAGTALGNAVAPFMHRYSAGPDTTLSPSITSTSSGVMTLGSLCFLRYGRWAAWPGLPVPIAWILAPLIVANLSIASSYRGSWEAYHEEIAHIASASSSSPAGNKPAEDSAVLAPSGLELSMALAACDAVEDRARNDCKPPLEDVVAWRSDVLEPATEFELPDPPNGSFLADIVGVFVALAGYAILRGRLL